MNFPYIGAKIYTTKQDATDEISPITKLTTLDLAKNQGHFVLNYCFFGPTEVSFDLVSVNYSLLPLSHLQCNAELLWSLADLKTLNNFPDCDY